MGHFKGRDRPVKNAELVHFSAFEAGIAESVADGEVWFTSFVGDVLVQAVPNHLQASRDSIDVHADSGRSAGAIVGDRHMGPAVDPYRFAGPDFQRIPRPHM